MHSNYLIKIRFLIVFFFAVTGIIFSQGAKTFGINNLRQIMDSIAGDATEGRFTGSPGYKKASEYIVNFLNKNGLEPGYTDHTGEKTYFQPVPFVKYSYDSLTSISIEINNNKKIFRHAAHDFVFKNCNSFNLNAAHSAVFIGYGIYEPDFSWNDYENIDVNGKVVIIKSGIPKNEIFSNKLRDKYDSYISCEKAKYKAFIKHNVAAVIEIPSKSAIENWENFVIRLYRFQYLHYSEITKDDFNIKNTIPHMVVNKEMAEFLLSDNNYWQDDYQPFELKSTKINIKIEGKKENIDCNNIIAVCPGTEPKFQNEYVTVCAHLDHLGKYDRYIYNGANDNASGCSIILETARYISQKPLKRPVYFIFYTAEEIGMYGSEQFFKHSPMPLNEIIVNINIEQIGSKNRECPGVIAIGPKQFENAFIKASLLFTHGENQYYYIDDKSNWIESTDTYIFYKNKIPSILMGSCGFPEYHKPEDKNDLIDFEHLYKSKVLLYSLINEIGDD